MTKFLAQFNAIIWGIPALVLILSVGIVISVRTRFVQLRLFPRAMSRLFSAFGRRSGQQGNVSAFQALCTALAATVGTGNLVGVAGAIAIGGPGSVFWMWVCAFLGMAIKYAEATLAVRFREKAENGEFMGGPMYMIRQGFDGKYLWLASVYAFFCIFAAFGVGNATQINAVLGSVEYTVSSLGYPMGAGGLFILGIILAGMILLLLLGGTKRIGNVVVRLVPFASALYIMLSAGVLILRFERIPDAFTSIFTGAFSPEAVTGGVIGSMLQVVRVGASRGVFTNEAGMGTAGIAHGAADVPHPCEQGMMGIVEVFLDTIVICTLTALVILCSGVPVEYGADQGVVLTLHAFSSVYGSWSDILLSLSLCCFAVATIIGWSFYGARCAQFLFGASAWKYFAIVQALVSVVSILLGTGMIWTLSEIVNGLMSIPNLIALLFLSPELIRLTKDYQYQSGRVSAVGGTNENFHQCKPLRTFSHEKVPSFGCQSQKRGNQDISSEYRSA